MRRIAPVSMVVRRKDVFDIKYDKFVMDPIMRPVELTGRGRELARELVELGFTDNFMLGKAPALELFHRIQDICNGFEPLEHFEVVEKDGKKVERRIIDHKPLPESPKIEALMDLLDEINVGENQVVVWCSRTLLINACAEAFEKAGYSYVLYNGKASAKEKAEAERRIKSKEADIFLGNPASGAFGLNCLAQCSYMVYICIDDSVETYHQSQHRILRGELTAPKFSYHIYTKGTIEERQQTRLKVGRELLGDSNTKEVFEVL
jgi:SNF2 family DNA or RNA helicase